MSLGSFATVKSDVYVIYAECMCIIKAVAVCQNFNNMNLKDYASKKTVLVQHVTLEAITGATLLVAYR